MNKLLFASLSLKLCLAEGADFPLSRNASSLEAADSLSTNAASLRAGACDCTFCTETTSVSASNTNTLGHWGCSSGTAVIDTLDIESTDGSAFTVRTRPSDTSKYYPSASSDGSVTCYNKGSGYVGSDTEISVTATCNNVFSRCPLKYDITAKCIGQSSPTKYPTSYNSPTKFPTYPTKFPTFPTSYNSPTKYPTTYTPSGSSGSCDLDSVLPDGCSASSDCLGFTCVLGSPFSDVSFSTGIDPCTDPISAHFKVDSSSSGNVLDINEEVDENGDFSVAVPTLNYAGTGLEVAVKGLKKSGDQVSGKFVVQACVPLVGCHELIDIANIQFAADCSSSVWKIVGIAVAGVAALGFFYYCICYRPKQQRLRNQQIWQQQEQVGQYAAPNPTATTVNVQY